MKQPRGQSLSGVIIGLVIIILVIGGVWWWVSSSNASVAPDGQITQQNGTDAAAASAAVQSFGSHLQQVSLMASSSAIQSAMQQQYTAYVAPSLLTKWLASPTTAPGRLTSSPWPDHIDVTSTTQNQDGTYTVAGSVVEKTSAGEAGSYPITATVANQNNAWLITSFSGYPPQTNH